ncbi:MAG TPA: secretin and TonB N-terminal domain-containing protein [Ramlibacter sp.]|nr:secretin and TonB N-terminal domain-containing protein [Ramlibacter sp.]
MTRTTTFRRSLLPLGLALALAGCAADQARREGQSLIDEGRYEEGLAKLNAAAAQSPNEPSLRAAAALQQERVLATLLATADSARLAGDYPAATEGYQRVLRLSPRNSRALDGLRALDQRRNQAEMQKQAQAAFRRGDLELAEKQLAAVLALDPRAEDALTLRRDIEAQRARTASPYPRLKTKFSRPVSLEFRDANLKMILDVLSRTTGINFIVDKDVKPDLKATIFVKQVPVEDALELLLSQSQLEKKVVNDNTVVIYPYTPAKIKDYQDWAIRTFFITNMDVKQAQTLIKTMLKTKDVFIDEKLNILTMRDSPDAIRLAEKLLAAQDQPEAEVVLEVELLDVSRDRFLDLGIQWPSTFTVLAPGGTAVALLSDLHGGRSSDRVGIDRSVQARAKSIDNDINTLASPRIRVRNKEKAKIHIGDRIPIVNATSIPSTQGPVITETVQYLDTGIKLEVEPTVYQNDEVAIKVGLEVSDSQDAGRTNSGTTLVRVKTSNAATVLRLKNGETQILAGLIRNDHSANADQIPGLGQIPAVGRLFGQHDDTWKKRELVLSITPRIVRSLPYMAPHLLEYASGTESILRARPLSLQEGDGEAIALSVPAGTSGSVATAPAPSVPAGVAAIAAPDGTARAAATAPAAAGASTDLSLALEGLHELKVGQEATLVLKIKADKPLLSTALQIGFDPKAVNILEVTEGPLMRQDGVETTFSARTDESAGRVFIGLARTGRVGITGEGALLQLRVKGVAATQAAPIKVVVFSGIGPGNRIQSAALPSPLDLAVVEP